MYFPERREPSAPHTPLGEQLTRRWLTIAAESAGLCDLGVHVCARVAANAAPCVGRCYG